MGGIVGRLFREFAVTLSVAIAISMVVSLTTTPMMCAHCCKEHYRTAGFTGLANAAFNWVVEYLRKNARRACCSIRPSRWWFFATIGLNVYLFIHVPKGFFPAAGQRAHERDRSGGSGYLVPSHGQTLLQMMKIVQADPAVATSTASPEAAAAGDRSNTARMFIIAEAAGGAKDLVDEVIARLRPKLANVPGASFTCRPRRTCASAGAAAARCTSSRCSGDNLQDLTIWAPDAAGELRTFPIITDVNSDQQNQRPAIDGAIRPRYGGALRHLVAADRQHALRRLRPAAGVHHVYALNQYHVVMEAAPQFWQNPQFLRQIYVQRRSGQQVPLSALTPLRADHRAAGGESPGPVSRGDDLLQSRAGRGAGRRGRRHRGSGAAKSACRPRSTRAFAGTAQAYQDSLRNEPLLIAAALVAVYIVLGILYESYIHPITILSTLPSAGVGALLALMFCTHRPEHHRHDRHHSADRHREEERHHDDRFRAGRRAQRGQELRATRFTKPACCASADSDDHHGGAAGRAAAGARARASGRSCAGRSASRSSAA